MIPDQHLRNDGARRERRLSLLIGASLVFFGSLGEVLYRELDVPTLVVRMLWAAVLGCTGLALPRVKLRTYGALVSLAAGASVALFSFTIWRSGGFLSPDFLYLAPLPLVMMVLFQDEVRASLVAAGTTFLAVGLLGVTGDTQLPVLVDCLSTTASFGALAVFGAFSFRRVRRAELATQLARNEVVEQLALSESRRNHSERLALLGQLAAGVAHELNNPLAYIGSNLTLLASETGLSSTTMNAAEVKELLTDVRTGVERLSQITGDLKAFSSGGADGVQDCDATEVIADALRLASLRIGKTIEVRRACEADVPLLRVNRRKLSQVLLNLLVNAAEALGEAKTSRPWISIAVDCVGDSVQIAIQDNGPGISPSVAARLFEPFVTSKPIGTGTGLGLALSREYVKGFGGELDLQQTQGAGARFSIRLPGIRAAT